MGLDRECIEFVTTGFFFSSFLFYGGVVLEHPVFSNNISNYFPDDLNKTSGFTIYVATWRPFSL